MSCEKGGMNWNYVSRNPGTLRIDSKQKQYGERLGYVFILSPTKAFHPADILTLEFMDLEQ